MTDVVDSRLASALHIQRMRRAEFDRDPATDHVIWQTSSIDALLDGEYEGDLTFGELAAHGDFGIGTVQHLNGEMMAIDGEFFNVTASGAVNRVPPSERTPFAVVCHFAPGPPRHLQGPLSFGQLTAYLDAHLGDFGHADDPVLALRVDGRFAALHLRSVPGQNTPYPPLAEVVAHQIEWAVPEATGSLIGFRFPDYAQGIDVAGYHLHFISDDRTIGGHVIDLTLIEGQARLDGSSDLHLEVPAGVQVNEADPSGLKGSVIRAVEGR